ncbi:unnamed protein product [Caenorhabditis auriculariae]|uniref:Protein sleepless n=1 Tax=Caenorhabditis auriculariae TaxID=2777116 RepID=A0A8S1HKD6_9PELO|nr:unnamed protein product [Caenorhabditis auriculariae]
MTSTGGVFVAFGLWIGVGVAASLSCYHCVSQIDDADSNDHERFALKTALFNRYNVPPAHKECLRGGDNVLFRSVAVERCANDTDFCVRIVSGVEDNRNSRSNKTLVMRGCLSTLFRPGFALNPTSNCTDYRNSQCLCSTDYCNSAKPRAFFSALVMLSSLRFILT